MKRWIKKNLVTVILTMIMLVGIGLIAYPSVADWWNSFHQSRAVSSYASVVASMDRNEYDDILKKAEEYNAKLAQKGIQWQSSDEEVAEYNEVLKVDNTGIMGYIDIPKIRVQLPIYHGTDESILQIAIGHLVGTSLPVGGESSHCIVSGHRGLPSARLFTDIDQLVPGDTWTLNVLDQTLTYEVDQVRVVLPTDLSYLALEEGQDYCTLVTCTPYGVNTHRLLVRGHRIANVQGNARVTADALQIEPVYVAPFVAAPMLVILFIMLLFTTRKGRRNRRE
ncbi:MAG: class C sortase [Lachnospiraceae bacterium]|nr:class C sortase [Lachnospiraceae bacterium]